MAEYWTIEYGGVEKSLEDWGVSGLRRTLRNQAADTVEFEVARDFDAEPLFAYNSTLVIRNGRKRTGGIYSDGSTWFVGAVGIAQASARGGGEGQFYVARGPWDWLERLPYLQAWQIKGSSGLTGHVWLNRNKNIKLQIIDILNAAIAMGAPIQVGIISPIAMVPASEATNIVCAEAIRTQTRWCPDAVCFFDYTTTPPTFHCRHASELPVKSYEIGESAWAEGELTRRDDLLLPVVLINFETTVEVDGQAILDVTHQKWPADASAMVRDALIFTINLEGEKVTHERVEVRSKTIQAGAGSSGTDAARLAWWKDKDQTLNQDGIIRNLSITNVTMEVIPDKILTGSPPVESDEPNPPLAVTLDKELISGCIPRWLEEERGYSARKMRIKATATFDLYRLDGTLAAKNYSRQMMLEITATNCPSGDYETIATVEGGETPSMFDGLAQWLYNVHNVVHYDGRIVLLERECSSGCVLGNRISLTGGTGRYATMAALVQESVEVVDTGLTMLRVGPPNHLGITDIVEWVRAFRRARKWTNPAMQDDGRLGRDAIEMPRKTPLTHAIAGPETATQMVIKTNATAGQIDLNSADCGGRIIKVREIDVCVDGIPKKMRVVCSEPY